MNRRNPFSNEWTKGPIRTRRDVACYVLPAAPVLPAETLQATSLRSGSCLSQGPDAKSLSLCASHCKFVKPLFLPVRSQIYRRRISRLPAASILAARAIPGSRNGILRATWNGNLRTSRKLGYTYILVLTFLYVYPPPIRPLDAPNTPSILQAIVQVAQNTRL
jgi:hypothetical protein